jgi:murein DD-endopeptidase MepM/ murein hydrolase activator NlpD
MSTRDLIARSQPFDSAQGQPLPWHNQVVQGLGLVAVVALVVAALVWHGPRRTPAALPSIPLGAPAMAPTPVPSPVPAKLEPTSFVWPASGRVSQAYSSAHPAVDIANHLGTPVHAVADGTVIQVVQGHDRYGTYIVLEHSEGYTTFYSHLSTAHVEAEQWVEKGQEIGLMGNTGLSTGPHLHFQVRKDGKPLSPFEVFPREEWTDVLVPDPATMPGSPHAESDAQGFVWPAAGSVSQGYSRHHRALDIANHTGTPIYAVGDSKVAQVGQDARNGIHIHLEHGEGYTTFYSHLDAAWVKAGEVVERGQEIGLMGDTGLSTGPHLHFEIRQDGVHHNPLEMLPQTEE